MTDWWWVDGRPARRQRDSREDDPDWYRNLGGDWVKRTEWTPENIPSMLEDPKAVMRYMEETTPAQRQALVTERMRQRGLVRWKDCWVTPERAEELEARFREGVEKAREDLRKVAEWKGRLFWC